MTNLEALKAKVNYPLESTKFEVALLDQGLNAADLYTGTSRDFDLALAAIYVVLVTSANISEGDYQLAATDKSNYLKLAAGIFTKYGVDNPLESTPTISNMSNYW